MVPLMGKRCPLPSRMSTQGIVEDLLQRGIAEHSEGAVCIFVEVRANVPHRLTRWFLPARPAHAHMEAATYVITVIYELRWQSGQRSERA